MPSQNRHPAGASGGKGGEFAPDQSGKTNIPTPATETSLKSKAGALGGGSATPKVIVKIPKIIGRQKYDVSVEVSQETADRIHMARRLNSIENTYEKQFPFLLKFGKEMEDKFKEDILDGLGNVHDVNVAVKSLRNVLDEAEASPEKRTFLEEMEDSVIVKITIDSESDIPKVFAVLQDWCGLVSKSPVEYQDALPEEAQFKEAVMRTEAVINEHWKPEGWNQMPKMPTVFTIELRSLPSSHHN